MKKSRILFIGGVNKSELPKGGEEYKNQLILHRLLEEPISLVVIDTFNWRKNPKVWIRILQYIFFVNVDTILISASSFSSYRLIQIINMIKPQLLFKTVYLVVGGFFPDAIESGVFKWKQYQGLKKIIVQGEKLSEKLKKNSQLDNIIVLRNFKSFPLLTFPNKSKNDFFRFVYVGRISEEKGIKVILEAVKILREERSKFILDIYGPIENEYNFENNTNYCGYLNFQNNPIESYNRLSEYDCLLFPTYWKGEGFPGVLIDAFVAGLPVIASDWNLNSEIIEDGVNGFIVEPRNIKSLVKKMQWVMDNTKKLEDIRKNNFEKAKDYHVDTIWPKLMDCVLR